MSVAPPKMGTYYGPKRNPRSAPELGPPFTFFFFLAFLESPLFSPNQAKKITFFCWGPNSSLEYQPPSNRMIGSPVTRPMAMALGEPEEGSLWFERCNAPNDFFLDNPG